MFAYSATKAGVRIMVRGWSQDLGPHGITVNAIGPGVIETPLAQGLAGDPGGVIRTRLEARTPVGRVGRPSDIAGARQFHGGPGRRIHERRVRADGRRYPRCARRLGTGREMRWTNCSGTWPRRRRGARNCSR